MNIKAIILDFDGVIVESVGIKDKAFESLFKKYDKYFKEIMDYHLVHNATIRFEKFEHIYKNILKEEYTESIKEDLCRRYSEFCVEKIIECPFVCGAKEFLEYFYGKVPLYVASINPPDEFLDILKARGIDKYFKGIYNVPWKKLDAIKDILEKENIDNSEAIFIGDSPEDYASAQNAQVLFVGVKSSKDLGEDVKVFENMYKIKEFIENE
ncbi:MAG: HAD hydrolase-like protein [Candidatus Zapsychrus exili]|nr:HAD hydrolase-like protein [Candidatus Zapsychrus exili]